jgi:serine-type D-Ala-D-Ala carboxypeptidase (penicillin-binding protein 5/6)
MSRPHVLDAPTGPSLPPPQPRRLTRRGRLLFGLAVIAALGVATAAVAIASEMRNDSRHHYLGANHWPAQGQAAYLIGNGQPHLGPHQIPAPIASIAKVMTAAVVLHDLPLRRGQDGPSLTVTKRDVADTNRRAGEDQSVVAVRAGERLSERDALMAMLLPSANNVATMLARFDAGSVPAFVAKMNATARSLGMTATTYTDPSGFDPRTVSTAADQLKLARVVAHNRTFDRMVRTRTYRLPVAGVVQNTDILLGTQGFVGTKTGSDDQAGSCFMFRVQRWIVRHRRGRMVTIIGVVLGQPGHNLITSGQYAARQLLDAVAPTAPTP